MVDIAESIELALQGRDRSTIIWVSDAVPGLSSTSVIRLGSPTPVVVSWDMTRLVLGLLLLPALAHADKTYAGGKGATWDCAKDPTVYINHGAGKYTFTGKCKAILINGGKNTLVVESVDELHVSGAKNTISLGEVAAIRVQGGRQPDHLQIRQDRRADHHRGRGRWRSGPQGEVTPC